MRRKLLTSLTLFALYTALAVPPVFFRSTQDLLSKFQLLDAYDKYVRDTDDKDDVEPPTPSVDKGKGKEKESLATSPQTPAVDPDDDEPGGAKGDKKKKITYKHLIKGAPGAFTVPSVVLNA